MKENKTKKEIERESHEDIKKRNTVSTEYLLSKGYISETDLTE